MLADRYPFYRRLRETHPVFRVAELDAWMVTSYESVNTSLRNPQLSSDRFPRLRQRLASKGLARLEAQIALRALRDHFPLLRFGDETIEYRNNFNLRGLKSLPLIFKL